MGPAVRRGLLLSLVVLSFACGGSTPTAPAATDRHPVVPTPPAPPTNSPSGAARIFTFDHELTYRVSDYTKQSRFLLDDNGTFALQYVSIGAEYHGKYTESNGVITFQWEGWSVAGPWAASGTLTDGSLTVRYNLIMELTDFENAVYRFMPSHD